MRDHNNCMLTIMHLMNCLRKSCFIYLLYYNICTIYTLSINIAIGFQFVCNLICIQEKYICKMRFWYSYSHFKYIVISFSFKDL